MPTPLLARDLIVVTGKGGVGKSTVAAALGLAAARRGRRTIVAEVAAPRRRLARPRRQRRPRGRARHRPAPPVDRPRGRAIEEYLAEQLPARAFADVLRASRMFASSPPRPPACASCSRSARSGSSPSPRAARPGPSPTTSSSSTRPRPATASPCSRRRGPSPRWRASGRVARQGRTIDAMLSDPAADRRRRGGPAGGDAGHRDARPPGRRPREPSVCDVGLVVANAVLAQRFSAGEAQALAAATDGRRPPSAPPARCTPARRPSARSCAVCDATPARRSPTLPFLASASLGRAELERLATELEGAL